jgi:hypothetical protein
MSSWSARAGRLPGSLAMARLSASERLQRPRPVALGGRVLGHAHRERGGEAPVLLGREACLGEAGRQGGVARLLRDADARADDGAFGQPRLVAFHRPDHLERAIQRRRRSIVLTDDPAGLGRAQPPVDHARRLASPLRNAQRVAPRRVRGRLAQKLGRRLHRVRVHLGPRARLVRPRDARVVLRDALERQGRRPRRRRAKRARLLQ